MSCVPTFGPSCMYTKRFFEICIWSSSPSIRLHNRLSEFDSRSQVRNLSVLPGVHTGSGFHSASHSMGTEISSPASKMTSICCEDKNYYSVPPLPHAPSWRARRQLYITNTVLHSSVIRASCTLWRNCNWTHAIEIWHSVLLKMTNLLRELFQFVVYLIRACMWPWSLMLAVFTIARPLVLHTNNLKLLDSCLLLRCGVRSNPKPRHERATEVTCGVSCALNYISSRHTHNTSCYSGFVAFGEINTIQTV